MARWLARLLIALALAGAAAIYWLFYDNSAPKGADYALDIGEIRRAAAAMPGAMPSRVEVEIVSRHMVPEIAMVAGTSWTKIEMVRNAYRVVAGDASIIIDTGFSRAAAEADGAEYGVKSYDDDAWLRLLAAMEEAALIVVTHEHKDHIGGLLESPNAERLLSKSLLNPEQVREAPAYLWPVADQQGYAPFDYSGAKAIAPGVVLIRAGGHTPGSQMVFVTLEGGAELLLLGDTATMLDNARLARQRSHFVTTYYSRDDRGAVARQLNALNDLMKAEPEIILVPGHDGIAIQSLIDQGTLEQGFSGPAAATGAADNDREAT